MAWVTPRAWTVGEVATAAKMNEISSALNDLDRRTSPTGAVISTSQSTTATSYADLATVGPAVTVTIGSTGKALVSLHSSIANATSGLASLYGFAITGATTVAAADSTAIGFTSPVSSGGIRTGTTLLVTGLNAGSTTFTAKYRMDPGTGPASYADRRIAVTPLGS